ncbi:NACHT, LRR and PYD domains-containing protein 3-like [Cololabis saira]|uniref:NACHT, LRR and PYD domains-containing protein 3-like n=1 Tax=Cololabis saira TaxID=129043 RepID=UPI002AD237BD|nr:NACHT, LRR and PYD domains-containing protein 3-like [Cololabis saira]
MSTFKVLLLRTLEDLEAEEFTNFKWYLQQEDILEDFPAIPKSRLEDAKRVEIVDQLVLSYCIYTIKVVNLVLQMINRNDLVENLSKKALEPADILAECQQKIKSKVQKKFQYAFEKMTKARNSRLLNEIFTEIFITMEDTGEVNMDHEVRQIEETSRKPEENDEATIRQEEIFKLPPGREEPIRTVMTKGVAGIGKTVLTQKFTLDWAEGRTNQDIQLLLPFTFRELNVLKERKFSLVALVHHFFTETKEAGISRFEKLQVVFIFDGLDECRLPLDFHNNEVVTDVTESTSVDVLLTNLIRGNLLPLARLWITTRPAAANQIPPECVSMVTEVRGFTDPQKEEYFRKRFTDKKQTSRIISHIKTSQSLHIMCHIPVFCWITATVLENVLETREGGELPKTLTEMYIHFLVVQAKLKNVKYHERSESDSHWNPENKKMMESLGKLAFEQLQQGHLIFYEEDLSECGIDIREASVYSGVFTQVFREESNLYQDKVFCFIHLSVQEFLAALHVHLTFISSGVNLLEEQTTSQSLETGGNEAAEINFYQSAVDKALESSNGHLDLFLRFLLGLSLQTNQNLLRGLLTKQRISQPVQTLRRGMTMTKGEISQTNKKIVEYIKKKIKKKNVTPERNINLFHCLNELNDRSLVNEIQWHLKFGSFSTEKLSPAHWAALVFILLSSQKDLETFDLKKYSASEDALFRLLPVVKASKKALLNGCNLSQRSCEALSSVLSSTSCNLRELDMSNNDLYDSGVKLFSTALKSPHCQLETLRLSGCLVTGEGCASLVSALSSNPSHLRELDLSYNHPGDSGVKLLSAGLENPDWKLETLCLDHCGAQRLRPGLKKYACDLRLDLNTAHRKLKLSDDGRTATRVIEEQPFPEHPDRFDVYCHLLCQDGLRGRCYWEVDWEGLVHIAVTYRRIPRKGDSVKSKFGGKDQSWSLSCADDRCFVCSDGKETFLSSSSSSPFSSPSSSPISSPSSSSSPSSLVSHRVGVYVDCPAGGLSFYSISPDRSVHLHTINTTFSEPVYPAFGFRKVDSRVCLCPL